MSDTLWELACFGAQAGVASVVLHEGAMIFWPHSMNSDVNLFLNVLIAAAVVKKYHT